MHDKPSIAERILDWIRRLKEAFSRLGNKEARAEHARLQKAEKLYLKAVEDAGWKYVRGKIGKAQENEKSEAERVSYSMKEIETINLHENARAVTQMHIIAELSGEEFKSDGKTSLKERVVTFFNSFGNEVYNPDMGDVSVTTSSFRDDKGHGLTYNKVISFSAIPDVLSKGKIIDIYHPENKPYTRIIVAAPISIAGEKYYMGVMVQRDNQSQRMYLHDVITEKATLSFTTEPTTQNGEGIRDKGHLFITSILQKALNVKPFEKNSDGNVRYSKKSFSQQVDEVLDGKDVSSTHLKIMDTPRLLQEAGLPDLPILLTAKHLKTITGKQAGKSKGNYHELEISLVKNLPKYLSDPVMIADSFTRDDSVVIITEAIDSQNRPVIAAIMLNGEGRLEKRHIKANILTSAYGRNNFQAFLDRIADSDSVIYWDEKKSQALSVSLGVQFPNAITSLDSNTIIRQAKAFVKEKSKKVDQKSDRTVHYSKKTVGEEVSDRIRRHIELLSDDGVRAKMEANANNKKVYTKEDSSRDKGGVYGQRDPAEPCDFSLYDHQQGSCQGRTR
ncbi:MAG: hypothetical protein IKJ35_04985 [Clostridia bacterium]|nr:hypothetical protein [Clostridia bacterium]